MLFIHMVDKVLDGSKTATSRIVKPGDVPITSIYFPDDGDWCEEIAYVTNNSRIVYQRRRGKDYAVQPGRGMKSVGRIRITGIERYDVRTITPERARLEGFKSVFAFLDVWTSMHDPTFNARWAGELRYGGDKVVAMLDALANRQSAKYDAWFLTFELLKGGE